MKLNLNIDTRFVTELVWTLRTAPTDSNHSGSTFHRAENILFRMTYLLGKDSAEIENFIEDMLADPLYKLSWGESFVESAARLDFVKFMFNTLNGLEVDFNAAVESGTSTFDAALDVAFTVREIAMNQAMVTMTAARLSGSSSSMDRITKQAELQIAAEMYKFLQRLDMNK